MEASLAAVLDLILRPDDPRLILQELCRRAGSSQAERQIALFVPRPNDSGQDAWQLAASGDLTPESTAALAGIQPERVSLALLEHSVGLPSDISPGEIDARHLYSATGEMLGMFICFNPDPAFVQRNDFTCRLAAAAMEHANLLAELTWQAERDALTGLYNRACFERLLKQRLPVGPCALLCMNLDRFRLINGVLGHSSGDALLRLVASRLAAALPPGSVFARVGGDEFAVLTTDGELVSDSLLRALEKAFAIGEHQIFVGATIGIACSHPESTPESLQREAYVALYQAKQTAKGKSLHFENSMTAIAPERLEMEMFLRGALERNEMSLCYQPQVQLSSGVICGAEALLRWNPKALGAISPAAFVPILEETGLIIEFGRWILREACRQVISWRRQTGVLLRIAVNVSAVQFLTPGFVDELQQLLQETGFPPEFLELELTESLFVGDFAKARSVLEEVHRLGVPLALDDFGTGQSSLSYLQKLPFQRLKIDQSFVRNIADGGENRALVENIVHLAASLGMSTIAEGIEGEDQMEILHIIGCEEGQGYLISKPLAPDKFLDLWLDYTATRTATIKR